GALHRGLGVRLVVGDDRLEPPPEHAAGVVGLLDRQLRTLDALLTEVLEAARQGLEHADLDGVGRAHDERKTEPERGGAGGRALHPAPARRGKRSGGGSDAPHGLISLVREGVRPDRGWSRPRGRTQTHAATRFSSGVPCSSAAATCALSTTMPKWVAMS